MRSPHSSTVIREDRMRMLNPLASPLQPAIVRVSIQARSSPPTRGSRIVCCAVALILAISTSTVAPSAYGQATADPTSGQTETATQSQTGDTGGESAATSAKGGDTEGG